MESTSVTSVSDVIGAVAFESLVVVAASNEWLLLDSSGQLIERQPWTEQVEGNIDAIGTLPDGRVVLKTGDRHWQADAELISFQPLDGSAELATWSKSEAAPAQLIESINQAYRGEGPSLERLILDLHSGRFFGPIGVLIYDLLAIALGFLAISGIVLWSRSRRNGRK